ncbi:unnamed protein product [Calicophoron daubneyi]|uniref:CWH43-like N-terminal domain-containing protein n=1 Tax=Calicophoron daubneyi TaxID=300641 RepID=A0AAV2TE34_CALDB
MGFRLNIIPLISGGIAVCGLFSVYELSCTLGHTDSLWPYISSLGVYAPESCLFTWFGSLYAILATISQWLWCSCMVHSLLTVGAPVSAFLLIVFMKISTVVCGLSLIGLFSINMEEANFLHYGFGMTCFVFYLIHLAGSLCLQRYLQSSDWLWISRAVLTVISICGLTLFVYFNYVALPLFTGEDYYHRRVEDGGYYEFMTSAVGEWLLVTAMVSYNALLAVDLQGFVIDFPTVYQTSSNMELSSVEIRSMGFA